MGVFPFVSQIQILSSSFADTKLVNLFVDKAEADRRYSFSTLDPMAGAYSSHLRNVHRVISPCPSGEGCLSTLCPCLRLRGIGHIVADVLQPASDKHGEGQRSTALYHEWLKAFLHTIKTPCPASSFINVCIAAPLSNHRSREAISIGLCLADYYMQAGRTLLARSSFDEHLLNTIQDVQVQIVIDKFLAILFR